MCLPEPDWEAGRLLRERVGHTVEGERQVRLAALDSTRVLLDSYVVCVNSTLGFQGWRWHKMAS